MDENCNSWHQLQQNETTDFLERTGCGIVRTQDGTIVVHNFPCFIYDCKYMQR